MKKFAKLAAAAALAALLVFSAAGCSNLASMTVNGDRLEDRATGVTYLAAPFCFEPVAVGAEYAAYRIGSEKTVLHKIADVDPTAWLTEDHDGVYFLFHNSEITPPTLKEFSPTVIHLCVQNEWTWEFETVTDAADIAEVVELWESADNVRHPGSTPLTTLRFKFSSDKTPGLYYSLIYADYGDARYLYNRELTRCVELGDLLKTYIDGAIEPVTPEEAET